eukprot:CAMPEP_0114236550 /NCGR_PEP_ID=MMETSP0058-20121206/6902_1 /TAXON_ID=36894 /ORGANISM="Pyramimonas parkeae, CCMP726" /LENGTH=382 /DNA_ID=CAMNT_0001348503 /DNA_START=75 /DNA_END=1223 /DNA_ORIENTATION=-
MKTIRIAQVLRPIPKIMPSARRVLTVRAEGNDGTHLVRLPAAIVAAALGAVSRLPGAAMAISENGACISGCELPITVAPVNGSSVIVGASGLEGGVIVAGVIALALLGAAGSSPNKKIPPSNNIRATKAAKSAVQVAGRKRPPSGGTLTIKNKPRRVSASLKPRTSTLPVRRSAMAASSARSRRRGSQRVLSPLGRAGSETLNISLAVSIAGVVALALVTGIGSVAYVEDLGNVTPPDQGTKTAPRTISNEVPAAPAVTAPPVSAAIEPATLDATLPSEPIDLPPPPPPAVSPPSEPLASQPAPASTTMAVASVEQDNADSANPLYSIALAIITAGVILAAGQGESGEGALDISVPPDSEDTLEKRVASAQRWIDTWRSKQK